MAVDFNNLVNDPGDNSTGTLIDVAQLKLLLMGAVVTSTSTGAVNNWAPGIAGHTLTLWNGAADATFSGQTLGQAGLLHVVRNITATKVAYFLHQSGLSSAGNKYTNAATSGATPIGPGGWIAHRHDGTDWQLVGHEQGAWITPAYADANFTTNAGDNWGVEAGDVTSFRWMLRGSTMTVAFTLSTTSVTGTPSELRISNATYGGFTGAAVVYNPAALGFQTATSYPTQLLMNATTYLVLKKTDSTNWAADTNVTYMYGEITFPVT